MEHKYTFVIVALCCLLLAPDATAQPWSYDFGTSTGSHTSSVSTTFLPAAPSGTSRVRIGSAGGSFAMEDQAITFGLSSYLRGVASTSTSYNKFSIYDYDAGSAFTLRFRIRFGDSNGAAAVSSGAWYLFVGDGATFGDNNVFSGTQVFTGLQWTFGESGAIATTYRNSGSWSTSGLSGTPFEQGASYIVEIYGNNTTTALPYQYGGAQSTGANTFDLWVNGSLVGDDLAKALLSNEANIDSWMFYGGSSVSNAANVFIDDIIYTNGVADTPLPVQLSAFVAQQSAEAVVLTWSTITEVNNYGFYVERRKEGETAFGAVAIGFVSGHGTTLERKSYRFEDRDVPPGVWYYRLRQVDLDGREHLSDAIRVQALTGTDEVTPAHFMLSQNYPNPFNPSTSISYHLPSQTRVTLTVQDLLGRVVATLVDGIEPAGSRVVRFDAAGLSSGIYTYRLQAGEQTSSMRMILLK